MHSIFSELSLVIAVAVAVSLFMRLIRQPLIIGHILTGLLVGPSFLHLIKSPETIQVFSDFGIALLLLIVGLGLNPRIIKEVGKIAGTIAIGKVLLTTLFGYAVSRLFGYSALPSLFVGVSLSFSSTIIILKLLNDKKEQSRLYGKISIGFLLVEDLIATILLVVVSASGSGGVTLNDFASLAIKCVGLIVGIWLVRIIFVNNMGNIIAKSQEFLFLFAIGWALGIAALFQAAGFSLEIGALIAGVSLASLPYAQEISSRLKVLRDFFIVLFFIGLGSHLQLHNVWHILPRAGILSLLVLIGNPLIVMTIMGLSGYTKKTSFKTAMLGTQVSEFSLILLLLANKLGHISQEVLSLLTIVALVTIAISTYLILYSDKLYVLFEKYLELFERRKVRQEHEQHHRYELVLIGYQKGGQEFLKVFKQLKKRYIVVDYDPAIIDSLEQHGAEYLYGDITDPELLEELNLEHSRLIVSTITDMTTNNMLAEWLAKNNPGAVFIATADTSDEAAELYGKGVAYVILPHYIGSEKIGSFIKKNGFNKTEFKKYREKHLAYLQTHYDLFAEPATDA
jgi:Kef-type K+ transport system membrane component KefB